MRKQIRVNTVHTYGYWRTPILGAFHPPLLDEVLRPTLALLLWQSHYTTTSTVAQCSTRSGHYTLMHLVFLNCRPIILFNLRNLSSGLMACHGSPIAAHAAIGICCTPCSRNQKVCKCETVQLCARFFMNLRLIISSELGNLSGGSIACRRSSICSDAAIGICCTPHCRNLKCATVQLCNCATVHLVILNCSL